MRLSNPSTRNIILAIRGLERNAPAEVLVHRVKRAGALGFVLSAADCSWIRPKERAVAGAHNLSDSMDHSMSKRMFTIKPQNVPNRRILESFRGRFNARLLARSKVSTQNSVPRRKQPDSFRSEWYRPPNCPHPEQIRHPACRCPRCCERRG